MYARLASRLTLTLFLALPGPLVAEVLELVGEYRWKVDNPNFGGISGLELEPDGNSFWAVSDRGFLFGAGLERDPRTDEIINVQTNIIEPIFFFGKGIPLPGPHVDAEGLALTADGNLFVTFEAVHRVRGLHLDPYETRYIPAHPAFSSLQNNSGLEALAVDPGGRLYMLPERSGKLDRPFPVYRVKDKEWDIPFHIPRRGLFLPVGADFGPDGRFYLLERQFLGIPGFLNRIRVFEIKDDQIVSEATLLETKRAIHDNLEGISVWRDKAGDIRLTMVSDDNFNFFQRTEIVEYRLTK